MITRIELHWIADFVGPGKMTINLTIDDQNDPRLLALRAWWDEQVKAETVEQARLNSGDPFTMT